MILPLGNWDREDCESRHHPAAGAWYSPRGKFELSLPPAHLTNLLEGNRMKFYAVILVFANQEIS
jgi:hypothetical protein